MTPGKARDGGGDKSPAFPEGVGAKELQLMDQGYGLPGGHGNSCVSKVCSWPGLTPGTSLKAMLINHDLVGTPRAPDNKSSRCIASYLHSPPFGILSVPVY